LQPELSTTRDEDRLTAGGVLAGLTGFLILGSALPWARPDVGPFSLHPYLPVLGIMVLVAALKRGTRWSFGPWGLGLLLVAMVSGVVNAHLGPSLSYLVKLATSMMMVWALTRVIETRRDFDFAAMALVVGVGLIGLRGLVLYAMSPTYYLNAMPGIASKNVYSQYTVGPLALAAWMVTSGANGRRKQLLLAGLLATMVVPQVLTLSRSGWIVIVATATMVAATRKSARTTWVVLLAGGFVYLAASQLGFWSRLDSRFQDLQEGTASDSLRQELIVEGVRVFAEHPVVGVSLPRVPKELGKKLLVGPIESHNTIIDVMAGLGVLGTSCVLIILAMFWLRSRMASRFGASWGRDEAALLGIVVVLGCLRGLTTNEILYNPALMMTVGLVNAAACQALLDLRLESSSRRESGSWGSTYYPSMPVTTRAL
jgi:hypothetical protein